MLMPTMAILAMDMVIPMPTEGMRDIPMPMELILTTMASQPMECHLDPAPAWMPSPKGWTPSLRDWMHLPRAFSQSITMARGLLMPMPMLTLMPIMGSVMAILMHMVTMAMLDILVMPMFPSDQALVLTPSLRVWMLPHRDTFPTGTTMATTTTASKSEETKSNLLLLLG